MQVKRLLSNLGLVCNATNVTIANKNNLRHRYAMTKPALQIWVDADACPVMIKNMLFKAANRVERPIIFVANQYLQVPPSPWIETVQVSQGFDVADDYIVEKISAGELLISADIPLAAEVIAKGAKVLTPRGEPLTQDNIGPRLNMRDFLENMRSSGEHTGGQQAMTQQDGQKFANALDKYLQKTRS